MKAIIEAHSGEVKTRIDGHERELRTAEQLVQEMRDELARGRAADALLAQQIATGSAGSEEVRAALEELNKLRERLTSDVKTELTAYIEVVDVKSKAFYEETQEHTKYLYGQLEEHGAQMARTESRVAEGEAGLRSVHAAVQQALGGGAAIGSAAGPFGAGAGLRPQAPTWAPPGMQEDPLQQNDAWLNAGSGQRQQGGGVPRTGAYSIFTPQRGPGAGVTSGRDVSTFTNLFDKKEAKELPRYDGKSGGSHWRKRVANYLVSRCPEIRSLLKWAEQEREPVSRASL